MNNGQYSVDVLIHGKPAKEFSQYINGEYKTFIEGREGTEYQIRVSNHSNQKLLAIAAVDSLNVVSGSVSDGYKGRGYIIQPYGNVIIKGFRESDSTVGAFKFTNKNNSYAKEKGMERNVGVIAVNLIAEQAIPAPPVITKTIIEEHHHHHYPEPKPYIPYNPWEPRWICSNNTSGGLTVNNSATYSCSNGDMAQTFMASSEPMIGCDSVGLSSNVEKRVADFPLGTSWGERVTDPIKRKHFEKGDVVGQFKIYYSTRQGLENMGVQFHPEKSIDWPSGFEGDYCSPPKGWRV